ncbi:hypothetical protein EOPP23_00335 [Endozoicomonas sp. OPT23]|uniref:hypothetical protein n=1 Tax=Endozoicomonas sp. OPT23 TaxID=2072845 RepID=UPI00129ACA9A|nr:hypothetical protein [Endozoicomonas sp. OPT23]MRI31436.1 hypothetical protein [Endozoicomonas sp. OPT23]
MKVYLSSVFVALVLFSSSSFAVLSCDRLDSSIRIIDRYADEVFIDNRIEDTSILDVELNGLVSEIEYIARQERDSKLRAWANQLSNYWVGLNWRQFRTTSDKIADRLDYFYVRDCR